ncbi:MAG: hypothetical protein O6920_05500 [Chloroflexi bacterium]|nr:hypothetical protein [Chloroflexota bacterium]
MAKNRKYPESRFHSPHAINVQEDDEQKPTAVTLKGSSLRIASVDERWEEEEPETGWRDTTTLKYYQVTLEDGQQVTLFRNLKLNRWYWPH